MEDGWLGTKLRSQGWKKFRITEMQFADDVAVFATLQDSLEHATTQFIQSGDSQSVCRRPRPWLWEVI